MDDSLLGFDIPEWGPALSIQKPLNPKLRLLNQNSPWEAMTFRCALCLSSGWTICSYTSVSQTLLLTLCPSVFSPSASIYCLFELVQLLRKIQVVAKTGYWIEEIVMKETFYILFNNFFNLSNSLSSKIIYSNVIRWTALLKVLEFACWVSISDNIVCSLFYAQIKFGSLLCWYV